MKDCEIIVGVCGGIAAYKVAILVRLLRQAGARVRVVMTRSAQAFVGPMTFQALTERLVCCDLFDDATGDDASIRHIDWAQQADAVVIAPATANMVGKLANGIADDALSTLMLAVTGPVLVCPSMNSQMYAHPSVGRNLERLASYGYQVLEPDAGELACGTTGPGRLPDPEVIFDRVQKLLQPKDLTGQRLLVTAGPTHEMIDPVRFVSNPSTGKMGYAIARAAEHRGATVTLVSGPTSLPAPLGVTIEAVVSAAEMAAAVRQHASETDIIVKAAAVADYRPLETADRKMKKSDANIRLEMERTEDILAGLGRDKGQRFLVGFAAETDHMEAHAQKKLTRKNLDMIVANPVGGEHAGFGADTNQATLLYADGKKEEIKSMPKHDLAHRILDRIVERLPS